MSLDWSSYALKTRLLFAALACMASLRLSAQTNIVPDAGKFILSLQEREFSTDTFTIDGNGNSESNLIINPGASKTAAHLSIRVEEGRLQSITADAQPGGKFVLTVSGQSGKLGIGPSGATDLPAMEVQLPVPLFPYSTVAPEHLTLILAAYDVQRMGPQTYNVVYSNTLGPAGLIEGKLVITAQGSKPMQIAGRNLPVFRYSLDIPTPLGAIEGELLTDSDHHVLKLSVPGQKLVCVRDGFQDLNRPEVQADPTLSVPNYEVKVDRNMHVFLRDGTLLAADVYRPDAPGKFPVILERTPYGRQNAFEATFYARRGYVFVAEDVRGKFGSEGEWHPFVNEARDGFDTIEWCAKQLWSNGNVGMIGASYLGFTQWAAARENNPHLKCLIPIVSPPDPFFNIPYAFGPMFLYGSLWWARTVEGREMHGFDSIRDLDALKTLPVADVDHAVLGHHIDFFQEWIAHPTNDSYWDQVNFGERLRKIGPLPALHISGWFDGDGIGTKRNYQSMVDSGHANQKLIYGPWTHAVNTSTRVGSLDFGPRSVLDLDTLYLRWFDHWLKGVKNNIDREPPVQVFLMGANQWRSFSAWPPKETKIKKWYFHSEGHANSNRSDGTLSERRPEAAEPADTYRYDPTHPFVPAPAGRPAESGPDGSMALLPHGAADSGVLFYTSEPLEHDVAAAGPVSLHLSAQSSAPDTDWYAALEDIAPDGTEIALVQGIAEARFRKSFETPSLLKPGEIAGYTIDMWAIGQVFKKGHRLRVIVASSCFPVFARNLNTGANNLTTVRTETAQQTIYHTGSRASYLLLNVLPE